MSEVSDDSARARRERERRGEGPGGLPDAGVYSFASTGPRSGPMPRGDFGAAAAPRRSHNVVFESLVTAEADVLGFVAYGLYKQSKRDWLMAFESEQGRPPNEGEIASYIVGESTERRLTTYRRLAEEILGERSAAPSAVRRATPAGAGSGRSRQSAGAAAAAPSGASDGRTEAPRRRSLAASAALFILLIILVAGMAFVLRSGVLPLGLGRW